MGARVLIVTLLALVACEHTSTKYCSLHGSDYSHCPAPDGAVVQCTGDDGCPINLHHCDTSLGVCVQCGSDSDCSGDTPRCDVGHGVCVQCVENSDCPIDSMVCLFGGTCQTSDNTAYVDAQNGADNASCSMAQPCKTVKAGLMTGKDFVRMSGQFDEMGGLVIPDNKNVTLIGAPGTTYTRSDKGAVIAIGMNGVVAIENLDITCSVADMGVGIDAKVGTYTFSQLQVHGPCAMGKAGGIQVAGAATVTMSRCAIYGTHAAGLVLTGAAQFDITNSLFYQNGSATADIPAGGVALGMGATGKQRFTFNTVADNKAKMMAMNVGGLACPPAPFAAANNILAGNLAGVTPSNATTGCTATSLTDDNLIAPYQTTYAAIDFVAPPTDYHVKLPSTAIDTVPTGTADTAITTDYDGEARPNGAYDFGADEHH